MNKKVSGCIVTFNNGKTIDSTVNSLLGNTACDFRLYVVDNGSTDDTVDHIIKTYPEVTVLETGKNVGFGQGHNFIMGLLDSDYHVIINPDISIRDDVISNMVEYMERHPEIGMLSPEIRFPDGRLQVLGKRVPLPHYLVASRMRGNKPGKLLSEYAMLDSNLSKPTEIQNATGCFMFIRTELFKQIGGFDRRYFMYFEDCDLARKVNSVSKVMYYPYATVYHEWGRESKKDIRLKIIQISSMLKYYAKWGLKQ